MIKLLYIKFVKFILVKFINIIFLILKINVKWNKM